MTILPFAFGTSLTVLLLAVGHWFPWPRRLSRLQAYTYGVGCLASGYTLWRLLVGDWLTVAGLWIIVILGGMTVIGAYWLDEKLHKLTTSLNKAEKAEHLIHDRIQKQ